jgi:hypothetical protein
MQPFREVITGEGRRIHVRRPDLGAPKLPITTIRAQRTPINRINKPKELTGTPPVTQLMPPVTTAEEHISNTDPLANEGDPLHPGQQ